MKDKRENVNEINQSRRDFLLGTTCVLGAVGMAGFAVPFIGSWQPSAKAKAAGAPVRVNISKIEPGQMIVVEWRGKPIYLLRRTAENLIDLEKGASLVADPESNNALQPDYIQGISRSISGREQMFIAIGICTHLGCAPKFRPEVGASDLGGEQWKGGFFCPCHGSRFDLAGRVYRGAPASNNLEIPPYRYLSDDIVIIGEDELS